FAATASLLALACFGCNRRLAHLVETANAQKYALDQQLLQSQKLAAVGELSSGIAHEINNPLAIIGQEAEWMQYLLKDRGKKIQEWQEELKDSSQQIVKQIDRCREITHKLLDFARKKEPIIQRAEINKLLEDMVKLVEKEAVQKGIILVRSYDETVPAILTDPPLIRQVVLNLLNNALYAVGTDGTITVSTFAEQDGWVVIEIKDTGCGIPQEHLRKIFDPFFTTKPVGKGTGLGLSICHGIVARLGGRINVESKTGEGTTFFVRFPLGREKEVSSNVLRT
ncbi:MAG: ATP-binding protein, partial [Desulforhabdus sp.]|nr:ATP-binding protein [Desulforhabdus sp.]